MARLGRTIAGAALLAAAAYGLVGCGSVPFLDRDPSLSRDRASRFDRFVDEVHLSLGDTAHRLDWARRDALASQIGDEAPLASGRGHWSAERRRQLLRDKLERHLLRLQDEFPPTRLDEARASTARILQFDLRRALDLADADDAATASPELREKVPSVWSGTWTEAPSNLYREHPARTAEQLQDWRDIVQWMADSEEGFPGLDAKTFAAEYGPRATFIAKALFADVSRRQASTGSGLEADPFLGPLATARAGLAPPEVAKLPGGDDGPLQRALRAKTNDWFTAVRDLQRALDGRSGTQTVTYLTGTQKDRWLLRLGDAIGPGKTPADLEAMARAELARLTMELGESLGLEDSSDLKATRAAFAQIRDGSRIVPGVNLPVRSPSELKDLLEKGLATFVDGPPPVLFKAALSRTFERPHGRWRPAVPGDLRPESDPVARPFVYLRPRPGDPTVPRWLWEAEAVRYGVRGEALVDAYRRAAVDRPLYLRAMPRETFQSAWGLYAAAEVFRAGELREVDRGFGWRVQELCAFAALIIDVGMHDRGWSYRQAIDAFLELTPVPEATAEDAVLRSIAEPGRDASTALALLRVRDARRTLEVLLADEFRPQEFHAALLTGGPVPMSEIQSRIESWLAQRAIASRQ